MQSEPRSYREADELLQGRCHDRRKIGNNTWLERRGADIAVRLHDTDVVTYHDDDTITLDTGGWFTVTTKDRMNRCSPFSISSNRGEWQVVVHRDWEHPTPYRDGMTWLGDHWDGAPTPDEVETERARRKQVRDDINAFIKSITPEDIVRQFNEPGGDCFLCRFDSDDCLASHVEEHYFHLTLARRAVADRGYRMPDVILSMIMSDAVNYNRVSRDLTDPLRKFLVKRLVTGVAVAR